MPAPRVLDLSKTYESPKGVAGFFSELNEGLQKRQKQQEIESIYKGYLQNDNEIEGYKEAILEAQTSNRFSPSERLELMSELTQVGTQLRENRKSLDTQLKKGKATAEDRERQKENLLKAGWPDYQAELYLDAPPGVKSTMEREHKELVERNIRSPLSEAPSKDNATDSEALPGKAPISLSTPIPEAINDKELPEIPKPQGMTNKERIDWENKNQKENNVELKKTQEKKKVYKTNDILINSMSNINDSGMLPSGLSRILIDPATGDIRDLAQIKGVNKETALYSKNLKQFLKGAKEFFGSRVTNFDVSTFLSQLPNLLNTEEGKRLILKQMSLVNQLESVHNNELDTALKKYGRNANYSDIVGVIDERVAAKEEKLLSKINNVVKASDYMDLIAANPEKFKGSTLMEKDGVFKVVKDADMKQASKSGWEAF